LESWQLGKGIRVFFKKEMIDLKRRRKLSEHLRHLSTGQISNDIFEERIMSDVTSGYLPEQFYRAKGINEIDRAILPIVERAWGLYDDTRNHKLIDSDKLSDYAKLEIARYILFLKSNREYSWENIHIMNPLICLPISDILKSVFSFGRYYRKIKQSRNEEFERVKKTGDFEYWPFKTISEFEKELKHHTFLSGQVGAV
jgi:hypothetical protein